MKVSNPYEDYYANQVGGNLHVFSGPVLQRGRGFGNIFRSLFRFIKPVFKAIMPMAKRAAPIIGNEMVRASSGVLEDVASGQSFKESAKERFKSAGESLGHKAIDHLRQSGSGLKRKRLVKKHHSKKRRQPTRSKIDIFS